MQFIALLEETERVCWFQQDGATAHTASSTLAMLAEFLGDRVIFKGLWPPRSPDLTSPDFFLWGYLKQKVYANNPRTVAELQTNIERCIATIPQAMLRRVSRNVIKRVNLCHREGGSHFKHLL
ncbi:hypothetical protein L798_07934 [Zootermopsis nevadensis]|uniref:Transposable element Tc3 transposase n=1 Tax=Zootermopsis nevadensis TaxID=136037 RepID=A0A067RT56_ZOONE|nr:hypothetical protein L798_07934 [Zootermopsis nevadensis]